MALNLIDRLGNWNPQLLRELKGCLKTRNVLVAVATSLLSQYLLFQWFQLQLPIPTNDRFNKYCLIKVPYDCFKDAAGHLIIDWHLWWLDIFVCLSAIGIFTLLVAGTYMLIANLAREERRGTLNFIRLSPQSTQSIFVGKLLGVPCLLYLAAILAIPLYLWSGLAAQIPLGEILAFGGVFICTCILFYSAALLYSLTTGWFGGVQAWVGSGIVLAFLMRMSLITPLYEALTGNYGNYHYNHSGFLHTPFDWLKLSSLFELIPHVSSSSFYLYQASKSWLPTLQ